jgi:hypothetical protein
MTPHYGPNPEFFYAASFIVGLAIGVCAALTWGV